MSTTLGADMAKLQLFLAEEWNTYGPEHVLALLADYDDTQLVSLLMCNIGASAHRLTLRQP